MYSIKDKDNNVIGRKAYVSSDEVNTDSLITTVGINNAVRTFTQILNKDVPMKYRLKVKRLFMQGINKETAKTIDPEIKKYYIVAIVLTKQALLGKYSTEIKFNRKEVS